MTPLVIVTVVIIVVVATAAYAGLRAAPYVPTFQRDVDRMLRLAKIQPNELVVDLGAGDGRFLITAARQYQARGFGYELSVLPFLVAFIRVRLSGVASRVSLKMKDFFLQNLSEANVVTCFLTPEAMAKLEPKFRRELKPGTRVVSYAFAMPTWKPAVVDKPSSTTTTVYLYTVPPPA